MPPAHMSTLPDSPLEPFLVPKQREIACSLIGREELVGKGFVPPLSRASVPIQVP